MKPFDHTLPAIETRGLRKVYTTPIKQPGLWSSLRAVIKPDLMQIEAVKGIDLVVKQGEIVGFLGPNGAGKTTTLKMLTGILYPTAGECRVLGYVPFERKHEMLRQIALVMGNKQQLWWDLPAWDSFVVLRELFEVDHAEFKRRVDFLVESLQLTDKVHTQVRKLSLGERMKCELVAALLHKPSVVFLDEPTIGLDVVSQKRIRQFLKNLNAVDGCTIVLTSHYMQDVQELCERVVVVDHGTKVFDGTLGELSLRYSDTRRLRLAFANGVPTDLATYGEVVEQSDNTVILSVPAGETASATAQILHKYDVADIAVEQVPVDDVIRDLFSRDLPDPKA